MDRALSIQGMGLVTDSCPDLGDFAKDLAPQGEWIAALSKIAVMNQSVVETHDVLTQLAIRAVHQAWKMGQLEQLSGEKIGLIFQTSWGMTDATVAYLESMLSDEGKYASPRYFSRSVYSSAASVTAIHFGIKGPCETLTFEQEILSGPLCQAWRLLAANRCERVVVVWGEQVNEVAADLAKRAAEKLHRREYARFVQDELGEGALALIVGKTGGGIVDVNLEKVRGLETEGMENNERKPFAMDSSLLLAKRLLSGDMLRASAR